MPSHTTLTMADTAPMWPPEVTDYRKLLQNFSRDIEAFAHAARELRSWMARNDPDYPLFHLAPPEGWANDPNGVTYDPHSGLYHRFFQYDKTYDEGCMHGVPRTTCSKYGYKGLNSNSRVWGHTVSKDLATWEDWPGIDADSEWDSKGVLSGNCAFDDAGRPVCIYSGSDCNFGVCAYSRDWLTWTKVGCMQHAPSVASQTNHDTAIFRVDGLWHLLIGGCTFNGSNTPLPGVTCAGNAQVWTSTDLRHIEYSHPLTPGGPGRYWELPYLLPFDVSGAALPNDQVAQAARHALLFGDGNAYYVGRYNSTWGRFVPDGTSTETRASTKIGGDGGGVSARIQAHAYNDAAAMDATLTTPGPPPGWPRPNMSDTSSYYSFNPHATDRRGDGGSVRRLMFGWVLGDVSAASAAGAVPYWQSAHSLARVVRLHGDSLVQTPAAEVAALRIGASRVAFRDLRIADGGSLYLPGIVGDSLEVIATFALGRARGTNATSFGVRLRQLDAPPAAGAAAAGDEHEGATTTFSCDVGWTPSNRAAPLSVGGTAAWPATILPQPTPGTVRLHIFLDRSVLEVYTGGAAVTQRCLLPPALWRRLKASGVSPARAATIDAYALGGDATLLSLESWRLGSMWGAVK